MTVRHGQPEDPRAVRARATTASVLASLALIGGCGGDETTTADGGPFRPVTVAPTTTVAPGTVTSATQPPRRATVRDARRAVDAGRFAEAERMLSALSAAERRAIRVRIANRLARGARAALRAGDRARVESLLAQARRFPATRLTRTVRADLRRAEARAAARDRDRRLDRQQAARERRGRARARRAAERARRAQQRQRNQP
jgi:hypothetical protein